ncbi:hypothetical protein V1264_022959 [Littorina saxatilis]
MMALALQSKLSDFTASGQENESYQQYERQLDSEIFDVLSSVRQLLIKYKMYSKSSDTPAVSGGLQQYILNKLKKKGDNENSLTQRLKALYLKDDIVKLGVEQGKTSMFDCLPVDVKLHIFSYLDAQNLCRACSVSRDWSELLWDDLLWRRRLQLDRRTWSQVSHVTNPQVYTDAASELSYKEIYLRCSPEVLALQREESSAFHQVSSVLKYFMPKKTPKAALFGPGIEGSTSLIVRRMLYENNSPFTRVALFPGQFDGFGAGMTLQLQSPTIHTFHLTVLYTATKNERDNNAGNQAENSRLSRNRMLNQQSSSQGDEEARYELLPALQQLCHTLNAFIFVVDASGSKESVAEGKTELKMMVQERWASPQVPVLVLSCIPTETSPRVPAVDVVQALDLSAFSRPWMVMNCTADTLENVEKGVRWMIEMCQRK